ncbi:MAG: DEAD/DEAH box helicase [Oscillospiraceae bacterium]|jgi:ATP-dependent Lhr-like helicase|nr:DEAD/DEAH box helicase [Oscillospiraceae bacterium]
MDSTAGVLSLFHDHTQSWFRDAFDGPTPTQTQGWPVLAEGRDALIIAPTGTGKTLAAFLLRLDSLFRRAECGDLPSAVDTLYITPLKALGNDIALNLEKPLQGIRAKFDQARDDRDVRPLPGIRAAIRHGDTAQSERAAMIKRPPHILITTPESLFLLLTSVNGSRMLSTCRTVIVDELHALLATKRGASLSLSLERLSALCERPPQRIGLSATLALPDEGAAFLCGAAPDGSPRPCAVVRPDAVKRADVAVEAPQVERDAGSVWPAMIRETYHAACANTSTLVFVNGRAPAEKMAAGLCTMAADDGEENPTNFARTHHGSLAKERRLEAERMLKSGSLKCLCATGSMELGIDVGEIDLVVQIGAPPTVAGGLQRLGRAGHSPTRVSRMRVLARTPLDTLDAALTVREMQAQRVEPDRAVRLALDVLAQHMLSCASNSASSPAVVDELLEMSRGAWGYRRLERGALVNTLRMLSGDYERGDMRMVRPRLYYDAIHETVKGDTYTRMLACAASTIPDRGLFAVWLEDGSARLGELDEEFVFEARIGDRFMLGAFAWQIVKIERDRVLVKATERAGAQTPFWKGDGFGRPYEVGRRFGERLRALEESMERAGGSNRLNRPLDLPVDDDASRAIRQLLKDQIEATGAVAHDRRIILEHFKTESGYDALMIHSPFGRRVHLPLSMLLRELILNDVGVDTLAFTGEYGILLTTVGCCELPDGLPAGVVRRHGSNADALVSALAALLPSTPLFGMTFRYAAARAMMFGARNGRRQPLWVQRERGARVLDRALSHPDHPLLVESLRECLTEHMDASGLADMLTQLGDGRIESLELRSAKPSPMTADLMLQFAGFEMYDYDPSPAAAAAARLTPDATVLAAMDSSRLRPPDPSILESAAPAPRLASPDALHAWLLTGGDARADELDAPAEWLESLHDADRVLYVEPGLWIAAEQLSEYECLETNAGIARVVERCLRFRGGMTAAQLEDRYARDLSDIIQTLAASGAVVEYGGVLWHSEVYSLASARTRAALRAAVVTAPPEAYAAWLASRMLPPAGPSRLESALRALSGMSMPLPRWEREILPARVPRYRSLQLDALLLSGIFRWSTKAAEDGVPLITFEETQSEGSSGGATRTADELSSLTEQESRVFATLNERGAMFSAALTQTLGFEARDALLSLAGRGLVGNDSLAPMRALNAAHPRVRSKFLAQAGRWFVSRPAEPGGESAESLLEQAFARWGVVCKETFAQSRGQAGSSSGFSWLEALDILRVWEYTGRVRRGYFARGLSGAQFVRDGDFTAIAAALSAPRPDWIVLPAKDPALAWGRLLPHDPERRFIAVDGSVVAMYGGRVELVAERSGQTLRWWDKGTEAVRALADAYRAERVYPEKTRLTAASFPEGGEDALVEAGFKRDGRAFTLWRLDMSV